jgi:predicted GIY-YIG superfamily endonuclease
MSQDFNKGKIYKITNDYNDDIYIGSTCDTLNRRFSNHKARFLFNLYKNNNIIFLFAFASLNFFIASQKLRKKSGCGFIHAS